MRIGLSCIIGVSCCLMASPGWAQQARTAAPTAVTEGEQENVARVNSWTVGVAGGRF